MTLVEDSTTSSSTGTSRKRLVDDRWGNGSTFISTAFDDTDDDDDDDASSSSSTAASIPGMMKISDQTLVTENETNRSQSDHNSLMLSSAAASAAAIHVPPPASSTYQQPQHSSALEPPAHHSQINNSREEDRQSKQQQQQQPQTKTNVSTGAGGTIVRSKSDSSNRSNNSLTKTPSVSFKSFVQVEDGVLTISHHDDNDGNKKDSVETNAITDGDDGGDGDGDEDDGDSIMEDSCRIVPSQRSVGSEEPARPGPPSPREEVNKFDDLVAFSSPRRPPPPPPSDHRTTTTDSNNNNNEDEDEDEDVDDDTIKSLLSYNNKNKKPTTAAVVVVPSNATVARPVGQTATPAVVEQPSAEGSMNYGRLYSSFNSFGQQDKNHDSLFGGLPYGYESFASLRSRAHTVCGDPSSPGSVAVVMTKDEGGSPTTVEVNGKEARLIQSLIQTANESSPNKKKEAVKEWIQSAAAAMLSPSQHTVVENSDRMSTRSNSLMVNELSSPPFADEKRRIRRSASASSGRRLRELRDQSFSAMSGEVHRRSNLEVGLQSIFDGVPLSQTKIRRGSQSVAGDQPTRRASRRDDHNKGRKGERRSRSTSNSRRSRSTSSSRRPRRSAPQTPNSAQKPLKQFSLEEYRLVQSAPTNRRALKRRVHSSSKLPEISEKPSSRGKKSERARSKSAEKKSKRSSSLSKQSVGTTIDEPELTVGDLNKSFIDKFLDHDVEANDSASQFLRPEEEQSTMEENNAALEKYTVDDRRGRDNKKKATRTKTRTSKSPSPRKISKSPSPRKKSGKSKSKETKDETGKSTSHKKKKTKSVKTKSSTKAPAEVPIKDDQHRSRSPEKVTLQDLPRQNIVKQDKNKDGYSPRQSMQKSKSLSNLDVRSYDTDDKLILIDRLKSLESPVATRSKSLRRLVVEKGDSSDDNDDEIFEVSRSSRNAQRNETKKPRSSSSKRSRSGRSATKLRGDRRSGQSSLMRSRSVSAIAPPPISEGSMLEIDHDTNSVCSELTDTFIKDKTKESSVAPDPTDNRRGKIRKHKSFNSRGLSTIGESSASGSCVGDQSTSDSLTKDGDLHISRRWASKPKKNDSATDQEPKSPKRSLDKVEKRRNGFKSMMTKLPFMK